MKLPQSEKRKSEKKVFPTVTWHGESWSDENPVPAEPVQLEQFLSRIRKEFRGVSHKDLYISFDKFSLTVAHSTAGMRKKAAAASRRNMRTIFGISTSWELHDTLRIMSREQTRTKGHFVHPANIAGDLLAGELRALQKRVLIAKPPELKQHEAARMEIHIPSRFYDKLRLAAQERNLTRSELGSQLLAEALRKMTASS